MLSVVIPTRNRADLLRKALRSIAGQQLRRDEFEILVVDNGSTDDTPVVVEEMASACGGIRYFFEPSAGLHVGRHRGLKEARGNVIVFADDDIRATRTWLAAIRECFLDDSVVLVGGNNLPEFATEPPRWLADLWSRQNRQYGGQAIESLSVLKLPEGRRKISPYLVWGCNFSIRRSTLLEAGGFHPDGLPQELIRFRGDGETHVSAYISRQNLTCLFDSAASVYHAVTPERMSTDYFRRRAFNQGISDSYTALRSATEVVLPRRMLKAGRRALRNLGNRIAGMKDFSTELGRLEREMSAGYREGYAFHQKAYRDDPEVRSWVHRPDYF